MQKCQDCNCKVYQQDPYYSSPCGTFCTEDMEKHITACEICANEFGEDFEEDEEDEQWERELRPDFVLIKIAHDLSHWNMPEYIEHIQAIDTVMLFDRNSRTHCCEVTPSYEMWPLYTTPTFKPEFDQEAQEELRDKIVQIIQENSDSLVEYRHVRSVDRMLEVPGSHYVIGDHCKDVPYSDESYDEQRDAAREYYNANWNL